MHTNIHSIASSGNSIFYIEYTYYCTFYYIADGGAGGSLFESRPSLRSLTLSFRNERRNELGAYIIIKKAMIKKVIKKLEDGGLGDV